MKRSEEIDLRYLRICREYAQLSRCLSRKVGSLLVNPDGVVIGLGVNGPPRGVPHCGGGLICMNCQKVIRNPKPNSEEGPPIFSCPLCGGELITNPHQDKCPRRFLELPITECPAVHAEINALLACGRTNNPTRDCSLYIWPLGPCKDCAAQIIQAGLKRIVFTEADWYDDLAPWMLGRTKIELTTYPPEALSSLGI